jgi:nucleotide-binding universal stress UspA family protein
MKLREKILLATEFGQSHADVMRTALALAQTFRSEILLVHVIPDIRDSPVGLETLKSALGGRLQELRSEIAGCDIRVADPIVAVGSPFYEIIELAEAHDVNVILVGSGKQAGESPFRMGLTAEKLIRKANKPVWVVKAGATAEFKTILCPVDFSESARRGLDQRHSSGANLPSQPDSTDGNSTAGPHLCHIGRDSRRGPGEIRGGATAAVRPLSGGLRLITSAGARLFGMAGRMSKSLRWPANKARTYW